MARYADLMNEAQALHDHARRYHEALPERIRLYLNQRGITDPVIALFLLGWNGKRIIIPIYNAEGELVFFKLAKDPHDTSESPKMLVPKGSYIELYGWEDVWRRPPYLILCEGEFDRLVLKAQGFFAVTSTGGAGSFREEWGERLQHIPYLYVCYDRDEAGHKGALKVGRLLPHAKLVTLPEEVGVGGDVTDFFVRLGRTKEDFLELLKAAEPVPPPAEPVVQVHPVLHHGVNTRLLQRIERVKEYIPLAEIAGRSVKFRTSGDRLVGRCPFHQDRTPSFVVYPATNTFHCFGCEKHGDVIDFVQAQEHLTFLEALQALESVYQYHEEGFHTDH